MIFRATVTSALARGAAAEPRDLYILAPSLAEAVREAEGASGGMVQRNLLRIECVGTPVISAGWRRES